MGKWADRFASLSWDSEDASSTEGRSREAPDPAAPGPDRFNGFNGFNYGGASDPAAPEPGRINRINRIHPGKPRRTVDSDRVLTVQEAVAAAMIRSVPRHRAIQHGATAGKLCPTTLPRRAPPSGAIAAPS